VNVTADPQYTEQPVHIHRTASPQYTEQPVHNTQNSQSTYTSYWAWNAFRNSIQSEYNRDIQNSDRLLTCSILATKNFTHIADALKRHVGRALQSLEVTLNFGNLH